MLYSLISSAAPSKYFVQTYVSRLARFGALWKIPDARTVSSSRFSRSNPANVGIGRRRTESGSKYIDCVTTSASGRSDAVNVRFGRVNVPIQSLARCAYAVDNYRG